MTTPTINQCNSTSRCAHDEVRNYVFRNSCNSFVFILQGLLNPPGLNICYMNSTFQCIAACNINIEGNGAQGSLTSILFGIFQHISQRLGPDHLAAINTLKQHLPAFNNKNQQDAFHFLEELVTRAGNMHVWKVCGYSIICNHAVT